MNARQKAKTDMFKVVREVCNDNPTIIALIPAFVNAFNDFKTFLTNLLDTDQQLSVPLAGITADKESDREDLTNITLTIIGSITAFANVTKNETLKGEADFTRSDLMHLREDQFVSVCQNIHDLTAERLTELTDYGVTTEKLSEHQHAIAAFSNAIPKPRVAKGQKTTLTSNIEEEIARIDDVLINRMDTLSVNFKQTHPDFFKNYKEARKIKNAPSTTTQLKGIITNNADDSPVNNAVVTVVELNISNTANSSGEYEFKPITFGKYTVRVTAEGFEPFEK